MKHYLSTNEMARESLRTGRAIVEPDRNRARHVRDTRLRYDRANIDQSGRDATMAHFYFRYWAGGFEFTVVVYERKRWFVEGDVDGIDVLSYGSPMGQGSAWKTTVRFSDLPAPVRAVAMDVRAALGGQDTRADKARAKSRAQKDAVRDRERARMIEEREETLRRFDQWDAGRESAIANFTKGKV